MRWLAFRIVVAMVIPLPVLTRLFLTGADRCLDLSVIILHGRHDWHSKRMYINELGCQWDFEAILAFKSAGQLRYFYRSIKLCRVSMGTHLGGIRAVDVKSVRRNII